MWFKVSYDAMPTVAYLEENNPPPSPPVSVAMKRPWLSFWDLQWCHAPISRQPNPSIKKHPPVQLYFSLLLCIWSRLYPLLTSCMIDEVWNQICHYNRWHQLRVVLPQKIQLCITCCFTVVKTKHPGTQIEEHQKETKMLIETKDNKLKIIARGVSKISFPVSFFWDGSFIRGEQGMCLMVLTSVQRNSLQDTDAKLRSMYECRSLMWFLFGYFICFS